VTRNLFLVVFPVQHFPLVRSLGTRPLLALDLPPHEGVDGFVGAHLAFDELVDLAADLLDVGEELDAVVVVERVQDEVRQAEGLLAGQLHRMMPFSFASFFFAILNMSE
jgi:hypothetical protein